MTDPILLKITELAAAHDAARWIDPYNGRMPVGFVEGAALGWGRFALKFVMGDPAAVFCSRASSGDANRDALAFYADRFAAQKLDNSRDGIDTLRHLWVFISALPGPETSWRWWVGRDTTNKTSVTASTVEAGLCQTSWNACAAAPNILVPLFERYLKVPEERLWRDVFSEGTGGKPDHPIENVGQGDGAVFQALSKLAPTFALEFACVVVRVLRRHYGTIRDHKVHLNPHIDDLLRQVSDLIATDPTLFHAALNDGV